MKPASFRYLAPRSEDEIVAALAEHGGEARLLAGGQSLVPMMNFRVATPAVLIDINRVTSLSFITTRDTALGIGALTRHAMLEDHQGVCGRLQVVAEALQHLAHRAVRNRGTMGGSLALAYPNAELPLLFVALDATLRLRSQQGEREIAAAEFINGPLDTLLAEGEFIHSASLPLPAGPVGSAFVEVCRRHGDFALAAAAALTRIGADGRIAEVRLGSSGGQGRPIRLVAAERALTNEKPDAARADEAVRAAIADLEIDEEPQVPAGYRRLLLTTVMQRALRAALDRAEARHVH